MAQRIPQQVIEEVRNRTNIVDVVGQYVQLKKSGKNYMGLCPFHEERSPSFSVAEDKQIYHCFGCGKGGNVFQFLQDLEGISFPEAVSKVAELEQIPVDIVLADYAKEEEGPGANRVLLELHEKAADLYHHMLVHTKVGEEALSYLLNRGLTMALIEEFKIGFAPMERAFLKQVLVNDQVSEQDMKETGLFVDLESGELLDRFYQRIMFPIRNPQGKTIAFSGRLLTNETFDGKGMPKYLNSPETEIFNKRVTLYNFDKARAAIRKTNEIYLFEGFMDVLAAWQSGIQNGVASMGTSLTNQQIAMLERVAKKMIICYDGDSAGINATNRAIQLLRDTKFQLSVVSIPEKLDPDDYVRKYGTDAFYEIAMHGRETIFSFKMRYGRLSHNMQNEKERLDYVEELLPELAAVPSVIEQDYYLNQIAQEFHLSIDSLAQQFQQIKQGVRQEQRAVQKRQDIPEAQAIKPERKRYNQVEKAERMLLNRIFNEQNVRNRMKQLPEFHFAHDEYQELYLLFDGYLSTHGNFDIADFLDYLKDDRLKQIVIEVSLQNFEEESTEKEISDILQLIATSSITDQIEEKKIRQQEASRIGNKALELELTIDIINLTRQLKNS